MIQKTHLLSMSKLNGILLGLCSLGGLVAPAKAATSREARPPSVVVEAPIWKKGEKLISFSAPAHRARTSSGSLTDRGRFLIPIPITWLDKIDRQVPIEIRYGWGSSQRQKGLWRLDLKPISLEVSGFADLLDGLMVQVEAKLRSEIHVLRVPHRALISPSGHGAEIWTVTNGVVARHPVVIVKTVATEAEVIFAGPQTPHFENLVLAGHHKTSPGRNVMGKFKSAVEDQGTSSDQQLHKAWSGDEK
jgi:hypothetical protein